jgi:hypothetical protein
MVIKATAALLGFGKERATGAAKARDGERRVRGTGFYSPGVALGMERGGLDAGFGLVELDRRRKVPTSIFGR